MGYYNSILGNNGGGGGGNMTMIIVVCICCMCVSCSAGAGLIWWTTKDKYVPANEKRDFWGIQ